ncbi:MAG: response regulator [Chloroflexi bacterium]|nr:response regulator [Chloroflexota bacterium]
MRLRVLAVDDDDKMRRLLKVNLETDDVEVREAGSGGECLRLMQDEPADLVLLDLDLPDGSGWDVLATMRATVETSRVPVIVLSVVPPDTNMLRRFKPEDYVQKPFDARNLTERVRRVLEKRVCDE